MMSNNELGRISAGAALTIFIIGVVAIVGAAALLVFRPGLKKNDTTVSANVEPFAARLERLDGDVGIAQPSGDQQGSYEDWTKATVNTPVSLGDRIYVRDGSGAAIAINRDNHIRLDRDTSLDILALSQGRTQLALREGTCVFDVGSLESDEIFEVGTPNGAVEFAQPGLYQVGIDDTGDTVVSVLNGLAQVVGLAGTGQVSKGQLMTLAAAEAAQVVIAALAPDVAGGIVNDYYRYRYPNVYDGRYSDYHVYEEDPYYYNQTYRRSTTYQFIPDDVPLAGLADLDDYGDWRDVPNYGHCWHPRASSEWAPYRDGYWSNDYRLGLTWVSNEQWGWAPYHYGRWARVDQEWYWVPKEIERRTVYAPALVAFVSLPRADEVGWVPLGPGDPYVPRYYDHNYEPRYQGSRDEIERYVNATSTVNYSDPSAVTIVSIDQFSKVITPARVRRTERGDLLNTRTIADPFAVPSVRQIAPTIEASRPVIALPAEVQQVVNKPVVVRQRPVAPNIAEGLKVQPVPETATRQKLQVKNSEQAVTSRETNGLPVVQAEAKQNQQTSQERAARIAALSAQAAQGNKAAKREMRQLEQQQRHELKAERKAAEQQAPTQQQQVEQRKGEKRAARQQAAQQAEQQRQAEVAQQAQQQQAQKRAARQAQQAAQQAEQQRQAQVAQQAQQQKAQKRAARQQAQQAAQQQAEQENARQKAQQNERRAQKQTQQQAQAQKQQHKAERRAQGQSAEKKPEQASPKKAGKKAGNAKNKNKNSGQ